MKHIPNILALLFLSITLTRVAELAGLLGAGLLGWLFAAGLGLGVYGAAYWQRSTDTALRRAAGVTLVFFTLADGLFNSADVWRTLTTIGVVSVAPFVVTDPVLALAGLLYAVFPTTAAALLGWMQGHVDRQPAPVARASLGGVIRAGWRVVIARIDAAGAPRRDIDATDAPKPAELAAGDATPATPDAPAATPEPELTPAQAYAAANGVSLRTAQRHLRDARQRQPAAVDA